MATGSGTNQVPGVQDTTEVNEVELDAEARGSYLETDTSEDEYGDNDEKFGGCFFQVMKQKPLITVAVTGLIQIVN